MDVIEKIKSALEECNLSLSHITGCSNHGCLITLPKKGMGTNGPCHCVRNKEHECRRALVILSKFRSEIEKLINE